MCLAPDLALRSSQAGLTFLREASRNNQGLLGMAEKTASSTECAAVLGTAGVGLWPACGPHIVRVEPLLQRALGQPHKPHRRGLAASHVVPGEKNQGHFKTRWSLPPLPLSISLGFSFILQAPTGDRVVLLWRLGLVPRVAEDKARSTGLERDSPFAG